MGLFGFCRDAPAAENSDAEHMLSLVDYMARDYMMGIAPGGDQILSPDEYQEMRNLSEILSDYLKRLGLAPENPIAQLTVGLQSDVQKRVPVSDLKKQAFLLRDELIRTYHIATAPSAPPNLERGKTIYEQTCMACHGLDGRSQTPTALQLKPPPAAFADPRLMDTLSPWQVFQTATFGLEKTAMPSFSILSEEDRWAVASYVFLLRSGLPANDGRAPIIPWDRAVTLTDGAIRDELKEKGADEAGTVQQLAAIRRFSVGVGSAGVASISNSKAVASVTAASSKVRESMEAYQRGDHATALDLAVAAYLDGFEKAEAVLNALKEHGLILEVERKFVAFRGAVREGKEADLKNSGDDLLKTLSLAQAKLEEAGSLSPQVAFLGAFSIIAREGVEAILLLAVILSILRASEYRRHRTMVHSSWLAALILGGLTWLLAHELISGQVREQMEGWISFLAALVLVYVSFWLIAKRDAEKWKKYLVGKIKSSQGFGLWTVGSIAFLAVYREAFETVLFAEALRLQTPHHGLWVAAGILVGFGFLFFVAWLIFKLGKLIPLNIFFSLSGGFLYLLAIVFLGQGIHSLQEANLVPQTQIPFVSVPAFGIFPSMEGLIGQSALILLFIGSLLWQQIVKEPREEAKLQDEVSHASAELLSVHELGEHLLEHLRELREKLAKSDISEGLMKEIIGHTEDLDREIHQVLLRLTKIHTDIPQRFLEIYEGVEGLEGGLDKDKLQERTREFRAHLESLKIK